MSLPNPACLLSDTIVGAIIGGLIGVSGTVAVLMFEYRKWKKALRVEHLRYERERAQALFARIYGSIVTSFKEGVEGVAQEFEIETHADIDFLCPPEVSATIREAMKLDPSKERVDAVRGSLATISISMKTRLAEIDRLIEKELGMRKRV